MKILSRLVQIQEEQAKRLMLSHLRSMSDRQLVDCGFSPQLISEGVKAWPWRELPEVTAPLQFDKDAFCTKVSEDTALNAFSADNGRLLQQDAA